MKNGRSFDVQNIYFLEMFYHRKKLNQLIIFRLSGVTALDNIY